MALQVRRGTNSERLAVTPVIGELIYVTDTKQLFVGDGTTVGGTTAVAGTIDSLLADTSPQLGGDLDLNSRNITGTGNINISGTITASGNINLGDGAGSDVLAIGGSIQGNMVPSFSHNYNLGASDVYWKEAWISQLNVDNQITAASIMADIIAADSTVIFNAASGLLSAAQLTGTLPAGVIPAAMTSNITGNLTGNANGSHTGTFDGDMTGSVFADDSTLVIDGINGNIHSNKIISDGTVVIDKESAGSSFLKVNGNNEYGALHLTTKGAGDLSAGVGRIGQVIFSVEDESGISSYASITGSRDAMFLAHAADKDFGPSTKYVIWSNGKLGVGKDTEALATLEVAGDSIVSGYTLFGRITTTQRDALTAANGMVIYNSTDNKFQGRENGVWVNLI